MLKPFTQQAGTSAQAARMVGRATVFAFGAASNLLAAWISRAPPCPRVPECPAAPTCPAVACGNLSCGEVHCRGSEQPLTCPVAQAAPPPAAAPAPPPEPEAPPAAAPVPAPVEFAFGSGLWSWIPLLLGHTLLFVGQFGRGLVKALWNLVRRGDGRPGAAARRRPALGMGTVSRRAAVASAESLGQIGESSGGDQ